MKKAELRKKYLERQKALSPEERTAKSRRLAARFLSIDLDDVKSIHCFIPIKKFNEIETMFIFEGIWREYPQIQTVVPRVDIELGEMRSLRFATKTELVENRWDIREPLHNETVDAREIDMVLVPLLCCDRRGHRVGYGKGFYDRFLKSCRPDCIKIGLSYFEPIKQIDDVYEGDATLDACVTPQGFSTFEN